VAVDGYSQPGATPNNLAAGSNAVLKIELDLSASEAVRVSGSATLLRGLALNRSTWRAIALDGGSHAVEGCFIGTDAAGTVALPNLAGVYLEESSGQNRIGGTTPSQRNLISGNTNDGIVIQGSSNLVQGNLVGTDRTGIVAIANGSGLLVVGAFGMGSNNNVIGGLEQGAGNVISGNGAVGVMVSGYIGASVRPAANTRIQANLIGVAVDGSLLPSPRGIFVIGNGVSGTLIGGDSVAPAGNSIAAVISGVDFGLNVGTPTTSSVRGNLIRGAQYGVSGIPNGGDITANVIGPNSGSGVFLQDFFGFLGRMTIRGNSISGHGGPGIDLAPAGVTPNDPGDADSGPNGLQNFPVIASAVRSGNSVAITGSLGSAPGNSYVVELFASPAAHPSGHGEGASSLGTISVTTDGAGTAPFSVVLPTTVPAGHVITATATDGAGNTSEFSAARPVQ
jgi:hypothetical protein